MSESGREVTEACNSASETEPSGSLRLRNMTLEEAARRVENQFGLGTVAADIRSMKFERSSREDLSSADDYGDLPEEAVYMTDEEIDIIAESMPGGIDGFLKGWGWRNFARAIEAEVLLTRPAAAQLSRAEVLEEAAREWQLIETAPKTGRTLLLGYPNALGKWRTVRGQWMSESYIAENWEEPDDAEAGWYETSAESDDVPNCWPITPTHWMPLPAAPEVKP